MASQSKFPAWMQYSGAGLELAGATAGLALTGYWVDGKFGTQPWGVLTGTLIGIVGGLYNLVKAALAASRDAGQDGAPRS